MTGTPLARGTRAIWQGPYSDPMAVTVVKVAVSLARRGFAYYLRDFNGDVFVGYSEDIQVNRDPAVARESSYDLG